MSSRRSGIVRRNRMRRLAAFQDNLCFHCSGLMLLLDPDGHYTADEGNHPDGASFDELVPRSKGGSGGPENQVIAHRRCNSARGDADPTQEELAKLEALNLVRRPSFGPGAGGAVRHHWGLESPAALHLADAIERLTGSEKARVSHAINSRIQKVRVDIKALRDVKDPNAHRKFLDLALKEHRTWTARLPAPFNGLVDNLLHAMRARELEAKQAAKTSTSGDAA